MESQEENKINLNTNESKERREISSENKSEIPQNEIKDKQPEPQSQLNSRVFTKPSERIKTKVIIHFHKLYNLLIIIFRM